MLKRLKEILMEVVCVVGAEINGGNLCCRD